MTKTKRLSILSNASTSVEPKAALPPVDVEWIRDITKNINEPVKTTVETTETVVVPAVNVEPSVGNEAIDLHELKMLSNPLKVKSPAISPVVVENEPELNNMTPLDQEQFQTNRDLYEQQTHQKQEKKEAVDETDEDRVWRKRMREKEYERTEEIRHKRVLYLQSLSETKMYSIGSFADKSIDEIETEIKRVEEFIRNENGVVFMQQACNFVFQAIEFAGTTFSPKPLVFKNYANTMSENLNHKDYIDTLSEIRQKYALASNISCETKLLFLVLCSSSTFFIKSLAGGATENTKRKRQHRRSSRRHRKHHRRSGYDSDSNQSSTSGYTDSTVSTGSIRNNNYVPYSNNTSQQPLIQPPAGTSMEYILNKLNKHA